MTRKLDLKSAALCISKYRRYRLYFFEKSIKLLSVSTSLQAHFQKQLEHNLKNAKVCNVIMNGTNGKRNLRYRYWGSGVRFRGP
jgi:hypothetical protein